MKTNDEILKRLNDFSKRSIQLWTEDGKLKFKAAAGILTDDDKSYLRANKEAVIECLSRNEIALEADTANLYEPFAMTEIQQAYVLGRNPAFEYGGTACHIYMEFAYEQLDHERVEEVFNLLINRHPMLRATMSTDGYQQIAETVPRFQVGIEMYDNPIKAAAGRRRIKGKLDHKIYDPNVWPLFSVVVSKESQKDIMHLSIEFVTADWTSIWTVLSEFESMYFYPEKNLPNIDVTFRDYLIAEKKLRQGSKFYRDKEYWLKRIDSLPAAPDLPILSGKDDSQVRFERVQFQLDKKQWDNFCITSRKYGVTPAAAVMCAYGMTLARWSRNKSFCLNLSILNRMDIHPQIGQIVGDFTESSLLEMEQGHDNSFYENALAVNRQLFDDLDHRLFTGIHILRELQKRKGRKSVLMPYVFTGAIGLIDPKKSELIGKITNNGISQTPQVFMDCQAMDTSEGLNINIDTRVGIFPEGLVQDICIAMKDLLICLANGEEIWQSRPFELELPQWQIEERRHVNDTLNIQEKYLLHQKAIEKLIENPDRLVVADHEVSWSGQELYFQVTKIAYALKNIGIGRGDFVAVAIPKSRWQTAACLGILSTGAAYVPIDVGQASKRYEYIMKKVAAGCVICLSDTQIELTTDIPLLLIDKLEEPNDFKFCPVHNEAKLSDTAYIIFTSGSTGEPKGVTMSHGAAVNTIEAVNNLFHINEDDRVLQISQLNFDLSVYDIFGVLGAGGGVIVPAQEHYRNPAHWIEMMNTYKVTIWNSVPALMQMLLIYRSYNENQFVEPLKAVLLSGDCIPVDQPVQIKSMFPDVHVVSLGGATEGGIWSIYHECAEADKKEYCIGSIPYGKPLSNQQFMIIDSLDQPCPVWVPGELCIAGDSLADSYWNDTELTKKAFVLINGKRVYRTGDIGCYLPTGVIKFIGREDTQVKLRGHRIELGEVESVIKKQFNVENVCCFIHKSNEEQKLAAVVQGKDKITEKDLTERLSLWLPSYMIPTVCIMADVIPLSINGKVDLNAVSFLVEKSLKDGQQSYDLTEEMTEIQQAIHHVMVEALAIERLNISDDFYEAGANSLVLARAAGQLNQKVDTSIPFDEFLVQLLNHPNIRELAEYIVQNTKHTKNRLEDSNSVTNDTIELVQNNINNNLCVVYTNELSDSIISKIRRAKDVNSILVSGVDNVQEIVEVVLRESTENCKISFLASDVMMMDCLLAASNVMTQGYIPRCVSIIETECESELTNEVPYMYDLRFGLTASDMSERNDIQDILEDICFGTIEILDCRSSDHMHDFVSFAINSKL